MVIDDAQIAVLIMHWRESFNAVIDCIGAMVCLSMFSSVCVCNLSSKSQSIKNLRHAVLCVNDSQDRIYLPSVDKLFPIL